MSHLAGVSPFEIPISHVMHGQEIEACEVSVVLPCLNESETIAKCVGKAVAALRRAGLRGEILVADNGSVDGSREIAEAAGARVINVTSRGYGSALLAGISAAKGRFVVMADSDDSYDLTQIDAYVEKLREGYDLVMGNRFRGKIAPGAMPFLHRYLGTPVLTMLAHIFFSSPCGDVNCGMRGMRKEAILSLNLRSLGMEFASEMLVKSSSFGLRIAEIPTNLAVDGRSTPPHLRTWRDGWRHLRFMLLYSPRWLFLYPGYLLMLLGMVLGAVLLTGDQHVGHVSLGVNTLVYCSIMVFIGYQLVTFAVFTKIYAVSAGFINKNARFDRIFNSVTLETGLGVAFLSVLIGLTLSIFAVWHWKETGFGHLDPSRSLRLVMPGVVFLGLGVQTIFSSFFLSVLGIGKR